MILYIYIYDIVYIYIYIWVHWYPNITPCQQKNGPGLRPAESLRSRTQKFMPVERSAVGAL